MEEETITSVDEEKVSKKPFYKSVIFYICMIILLCTFIFNCFYCISIVSGDSMVPNFHDGQILLVERHYDKIDRYDVVALDAGNKLLVKRVIGLPGETIDCRNDVIYVDNMKLADPYKNGEMIESFTITLKENEYYCLGDNRRQSRDSRYYGAFTEKEIIGKIKGKD